MRILNRPTKLIAIGLALAALAAIWTVWGTKRAEAVIAIIRTTGMFSLAQGQATSAYVVNTWTGDERGMVVSWTVLDSAGNTLAQSERRTVEAGQASSFEYRPPELTEGQRMAIRFVLTIEGVNRNKPGFVATQGIWNPGDGKTTVFLPYIEQ